jgi:hypothetical protein
MFGDIPKNFFRPPEFLLSPVVLQCYLDGMVELAFIKWFQDKPEGACCLRAADSLLIGIGGEVDDRDIHPGMDLRHSLDAVGGSLKDDIHQEQIGVEFFGSA